MKRRFIIVPKDNDAEIALDYDIAKNEQIIELILNEDEFYFLVSNKVFELINKVGSSNIDDYEYEAINMPFNISKIISALENEILICNDDNLILLIKKILAMFKEAIKRETGIYFYF